MPFLFRHAQLVCFISIFLALVANARGSSDVSGRARSAAGLQLGQLDALSEALRAHHSLRSLSVLLTEVEGALLNNLSSSAWPTQDCNHTQQHLRRSDKHQQRQHQSSYDSVPLHQHEQNGKLGQLDQQQHGLASNWQQEEGHEHHWEQLRTSPHTGAVANEDREEGREGEREGISAGGREIKGEQGRKKAAQRRLLQAPAPDQLPPLTPYPPPAAPVILAPNRTRRKNPLGGFAYWDGGWNFFTSDYWASLAWSAVYAPCFAVGWVLFGLGILITILAICMCFRGRWRHLRDGTLRYKPGDLRLPLVFMVVGLVICLTGCGLMIVGGVQFNNKVKALTSFTEQQVEFITNIAFNITSILTELVTSPFITSKVSLDTQTKINNTINDINSYAQNALDKTQSGQNKINEVSDDVQLALFIVGCITVAAVLIGMTFGILRWVIASNCMVAFIWLLSFVTWILVTIFLFTWTFTGDTTVALDQVALAPSDLSAFNLLVPCIDPASVTNLQTFARFLGYTAITGVNYSIATQAPFIFEKLNVSGLCNPFGPGPNYTIDTTACNYTCRPQAPSQAASCPGRLADLNSTLDLLQGLECPLNDPAACEKKGLIVASTLAAILAAAEYLLGMQTSYPLLGSVARCVYITFIATSVSNQVNDMETYAVLLWVGFLLISVGAMVFSVCLPIYVYRGVRCYDRLQPEVDDEPEGIMAGEDLDHTDPSGPISGEHDGASDKHYPEDGSYASEQPKSAESGDSGRPSQEQSYQQSYQSHETDPMAAHQGAGSNGASAPQYEGSWSKG